MLDSHENQPPQNSADGLPTPPEALLARLDALGIDYLRYHHPPLFTVEESKAHQKDQPGAHIKNLFTKNKKGELWMMTVLQDRVVDLNRFSKALGAGRVSFTNAELLMQYWGVRPGAVTPLGAINDTECKVQVVLDAAIMAAEMVYCHPLVNDQTLRLKPADLLVFLRDTGHEPLIAEVPEREATE